MSQGDAKGLGAIVNARAGRLLRDPELVARVRDVVGDAGCFATGNAEEVPEALSALRDRGCETLLVVGGDGTVSRTLTALLRVFSEDQRPAVALTEGGTVNTIPKALGSAGAPEQVAAALQRGAPRTVQRRATVRVRADDGDPMDGMLFVSGIGVRFLERYYEDTGQGLSGAALVIARTVGSALVGGDAASAMFAPFRAELRCDGERIERRSFTVFGAGGIPEIGLGFRPFRTAGRDPEHVHLIYSGASALGFLTEMPGLLFGLEWPGSSVVHRPVREAVIRPDEPQPWSIDAEMFPPARELWVQAGPILDFVSVQA